MEPFSYREYFTYDREKAFFGAPGLQANRYEAPETLPEYIVPIEKQIRVYLAGEEIPHESLGDGEERVWRYVQPDGSGPVGRRIWILTWDGVENSGNIGHGQMIAYRSNGSAFKIPWEYVASGTLSQMTETNWLRAWDEVWSTRFNTHPSGARVRIRFPFPIDIAQFGFARNQTSHVNCNGNNYRFRAIGIANDLFQGNSTSEWAAQSEEVIHDTGPPPGWSGSGSNINACAAYNNYPAIGVEDFLLTDDFYGYEGDPVNDSPFIEFDPPLPLNHNKHLVIWRETRMDRPWINFRLGAGGRLRAADQNIAWKQRLFIYQELCELVELSGLLGFPLIPTPPPRELAETVAVIYANGHSGTAPKSYENLELLTGVPGAPTDDKWQIAVDRGDQTDGSSTIWEEIPESDYVVDSTANTVTRNDSSSRDMRIRRATRIDRIWPILNESYHWSSGMIGLGYRQLRFLWEESCILPVFPPDSPLANGIWPRPLNWLVYSGPGDVFSFQGLAWYGDGDLFVFDNDLLLQEGVDYFVNPVDFTITIPGGANGAVVIGGGGGNPEDNDDSTGEGADEPWFVYPWYQIDSIDVPTPSKFTIAVSSHREVNTAAWKTYIDTTYSVTSPGNIAPAIAGGNAIKVEITANEDVGTFSAGHKWVAYVGFWCPQNGAFNTSFLLSGPGATSWSLTSQGTTIPCDQAIPVLSASVRNEIANLAGNPNNSAAERLAGALAGNFQTSTENIGNLPGGQAWSNLSQLNANWAAATGGPLGFSSAQFDSYSQNPNAFTDFDIPEDA